MINSIVWCMMTVVINHGGVDIQVETSVKGAVISENVLSYIIDFSEYATDKKYVGDYSNRLINKDLCIDEKR